MLGTSTQQGTVAKAELTKYAPNQLHYNVESNKGGVLVFSEVYYPGWTATVDGQPIELGRVNYLLRALAIKPGKHEVVLSFFPKSIDRTETIAYISYAALLLLIAATVFLDWRRKKKEA